MYYHGVSPQLGSFVDIISEIGNEAAKIIQQFRPAPGSVSTQRSPWERAPWELPGTTGPYMTRLPTTPDNIFPTQMQTTMTDLLPWIAGGALLFMAWKGRR